KPSAIGAKRDDGIAVNLQVADAGAATSVPDLDEGRWPTAERSGRHPATVRANGDVRQLRLIQNDPAGWTVRIEDKRPEAVQAADDEASAVRGKIGLPEVARGVQQPRRADP